MKKFPMVLMGLAMVACTVPMMGQETSGQKPMAIAPGTQLSPAKVFDNQLSGFEKEMVPLAEAMPADKYTFAPTNGKFDGVRNFGEQVRHVAQANALYAATIMGTKPDATFLKDAKTKDELVAGLKKSFEDAHAAIATITPQNAFDAIPPAFGKNPTTRAGMAAQIVQHGFDHFGQMVEYLRMNGMVPPSSQR